MAGGAQCVDCAAPTNLGHMRCRRCYLNRWSATPLRRWRRDSGRSYRWLSERTRVSVSTLRRLAAGHQTTARVVVAVSEATQIPVAELVGVVGG